MLGRRCPRNYTYTGYETDKLIANFKDSHYKNGAQRWNSNSRIPFEDMLTDWMELDLISETVLKESLVVREREDEESMKEYITARDSYETAKASMPTQVFKLYQIHLTKAEHDQVNRDGHDSVHKQALKLDMNLRKNDTGAIAKEAFDLGYYTHVSNITAKDYEDVFETGNIGPEENIERISDMYSCSVGDIVEDSQGNKKVVASMGFKDVA